MNNLYDFLYKLEEYNEIINSIGKQISPINITGISESQKSHLITSIQKHTARNAIIITYSDFEAKNIYEDMRFFLGEEVRLFPAKDFVLYDVDAYSTDILQQRLMVLDSLTEHRENNVIITSLKAVLQLIVPCEVYKKYSMHLEVGDVYNLQELTEKFIIMGYRRVDMVEGKGQFSVRGGIVDIYPLITEDAYRIEFFDDEIDSIRIFDTDTQVSISKINTAYLSIARETVFDISEAEKLSNDLEKIVNSAKNKSIITEHIHKDIEKINETHYFPSADKYISLIYNVKSTILEYFSDRILIFFDEPLKIQKHAKTIELEYNDMVSSALEKGLIIKQSGELMIDYQDLFNRIKSKVLIGLNMFPHSNPGYMPKINVNILSKTLHTYRGNIGQVCEDLRIWMQKGYNVIILSGSTDKANRFIEVLKDNDIYVQYLPSINNGDIKEQISSDKIPSTDGFAETNDLSGGKIIVTKGSLSSGFEYPEANFALISDKEILGEAKKVRKVRGVKNKDRIKSFTDISVGDYVVHQNHGIGQYVGIEKLVIEGTTRDYLKIKYLKSDYLYVPTNQLDIIQKYIGAQARAPRLNKLGGSDWTKVRTRVKHSVKELAKGLIELYAARAELKGYSFSSDTQWQGQFEETFPYEETPDQIRSIEEVKSDMEKILPMDRLLCGDVGYGKTEVAIRAAFKAIMDSKQVAYLVPTTVLAQQHYSNFLERMKGFPVTVEMLSRFRSTKEQKSIIKKIRTGEIDIIVGTHRLLSKDIIFKDLGLLIIDEEQRFGVSHKERLKALKKDVDVLTLTATPIPRTLHMSMVGIRDMSLIGEPPEDRYPVQTYVLEYNESLIKDAIERELARNGQVYYLHNRVRTIHKITEKIRRIVPRARIGVAHGQMDERELENVMMDLLEGKIDILICTTIIETGLDIPNVNTIIIEDADRMGLAQLYQLRGRVGRSNRIAYAYITYKKDKVLQHEAEKRLQAIKEFTEFGSGFKIAMRDLEIRGAGNLLGPEQHGHMEAVGYDMYCKILDESVKELKGETITEEVPVIIELTVDAYIPESYISNHDNRIEIYKKIAAIGNSKDYYEVEEEVEDRYGDAPTPVINLLTIATIKIMASELSIILIKQSGNSIVIQFKDGTNINMKTIIDISEEYRGKIMLTASNKPYITVKLNKDEGQNVLRNIKIMLQRLKQLQPNGF
jgi:transcription-repair coupling factor (superfamily II helicase)